MARGSTGLSTTGGRGKKIHIQYIIRKYILMYPYIYIYVLDYLLSTT